MSKKKKEIELKQQRAMIYLPEEAVSVKLVATVYVNGELKNAQRELGLKEIRQAFEDADKNYIEDDDMFALTNKGKQIADRLEMEELERYLP